IVVEIGASRGVASPSFTLGTRRDRVLACLFETQSPVDRPMDLIHERRDEIGLEPQVALVVLDLAVARDDDGDDLSGRHAVSLRSFASLRGESCSREQRHYSTGSTRRLSHSCFLAGRIRPVHRRPPPLLSLAVPPLA